MKTPFSIAYIVSSIVFVIAIFIMKEDAPSGDGFVAIATVSLIVAFGAGMVLSLSNIADAD